MSQDLLNRIGICLDEDRKDPELLQTAVPLVIEKLSSVISRLKTLGVQDNFHFEMPEMIF